MIPCELIVMKILPIVRKETVLMLVKKGEKQRNIARKLHISEAAISQYLAKRRGNRKKNSLLSKIIAKKMKKYNEAISFEENVCNICKDLRRSNDLCRVHLSNKKIKIDKEICEFCKSVC